MVFVFQIIIIISASAVLTVRGDECSFGRQDLSPKSPNPTSGLFIDKDNPALCSGQITHWRVCYYNPRNFEMGNTLKILLQTWKLRNKHYATRIGSYSTSLLIPQERHDYQCVNITVEPEDYILVEKGHYIAVYIFNNAVLPIVAHSKGSSLFHFPFGGSVPDTIVHSTGDIITNQAIHLSATIVTSSSEDTPHDTSPTVMQFLGTSATLVTNPQSAQGSRGATVGVVLVTLVAIAVTVIIVVTVILVIKRRSIPVASIKDGPDNIYAEEPNEYQEIQVKEAASNYKVPVASEAAASKQPGHISANICPAYGINTTTPNLGLGREEQEDVEGTPGNGELLTSGPNKLSVSAVSTREDIPIHNTDDTYEYEEMDPLSHSIYINMQPMNSNEYTEMEPVKQCDYVEMEPVKQCDYVEMQPAFLPAITSSPNQNSEKDNIVL